MIIQVFQTANCPLDKHKNDPIPYKYKKWKNRDIETREEIIKARDIQGLLHHNYSIVHKVLRKSSKLIKK